MAEVTNQNDALNVLISAVKIAVKRGSFELEEIESILKAIRVFIPEEVKKVVEDVKSEVATTKQELKTLAQ